MVFPVIVASGEQSQFIRKMCGNGIVGAYWPDLPMEVERNKSKFPDTYFLYEHLVMLPVHELADECVLEQKIEGLKAVL